MRRILLRHTMLLTSLDHHHPLPIFPQLINHCCTILHLRLDHSLVGKMENAMFQGVEKWKNHLLVLFTTTQIGYQTKEGRYGNAFE